MGAKLSIKPAADYRELISEYVATVMMQYNITPRQMRRLLAMFRSYQSDTWTIADFTKLLKIYSESIVFPSLEALVKFGSSSRDGKLGFEDFIVAVCSFCALSKEEILQFVYIVIDSNRSGLLDKEELFAFYSVSVRLKRIHNQRQAIHPPNYVAALQRFRDGKWKALSFEEFCLMCDLFPHLAFPTIRLQDLLRRAVLGSRFWKKWDLERRTIFTLESDSKPINFTGTSLITGELQSVVKPGRVSMMEIFEYTKRNGLKEIPSEESVVKQQYEIESITKERDSILIRAPLLNLIRNPNSVYHVPLADRHLSEKRESTLPLPIGEGRKQRGQLLGALDISTDRFL